MRVAVLWSLYLFFMALTIVSTVIMFGGGCGGVVDDPAPVLREVGPAAGASGAALTAEYCSDQTLVDSAQRYFEWQKRADAAVCYGATFDTGMTCLAGNSSARWTLYSLYPVSGVRVSYAVRSYDPYESWSFECECNRPNPVKCYRF